MNPVIVITGIKAIDKKLKKLPMKVQRKVVSQSMRAGLKIMQAEVKSQVPSKTGMTRQNVKVRALKKRKRGQVAMEVRMGGDPKLFITTRSGQRFFIPALIEYGSSQNQPNPFMRRSFTARGDATKTATMAKMLEGVEREVKSL